jgi:hypothetical protein
MNYEMWMNRKGISEGYLFLFMENKSQISSLIVYQQGINYLCSVNEQVWVYYDSLIWIVYGEKLVHTPADNGRR